MLIGLQVDIVEDGDPTPIVRHEFFGASREEVSARFANHVNQDPFLAECWAGDREGLSVLYRWGSKEM